MAELSCDSPEAPDTFSPSKPLIALNCKNL